MEFVELITLIKQIERKIESKLDEELKSTELTNSQADVIAFLLEKGNVCTQKEIEETLKVSHPTITRMVKKLEEKGFLKCYIDEDDKRSKIVLATSKALNCSEEIELSINECGYTLLDSFSNNEISELHRLLEKMYKNIK